ncbi:hypothetical protein PMAYCL1PPCAC_26935, partial [Pristionchus mayeri]
RRRSYHTNFFYTIYMIGCSIDVVAMVGNHIGAVFPSRGWLLDFYLSSTIPGRIWSRRLTRWLAVAFQLSGVITGVLAATRDVYWVKEGYDSWYIQVVVMYLLKNINITHCLTINVAIQKKKYVQIFPIGFFIINDVYGGLSPYLLIILSKPVRRDFLRMFG